MTLNVIDATGKRGTVDAVELAWREWGMTSRAQYNAEHCAYCAKPSDYRVWTSFSMFLLERGYRYTPIVQLDFGE